jgi:hypothetical protein
MPARSRKRWSQRVTQTSDALDLEPGVFSLNDPRRIARSLKRSAERSRRRKAGAFRSAMSMLTFYMNRAGGHLSKGRLDRLQAAKDELRLLYRRPRRPRSSSSSKAAVVSHKGGTMATRRKSSGRSRGRRYSSGASRSVESAMRRRKKGTLRSGRGGRGGRVKSRKQAVAIGLSEARRKGARVPSRGRSKGGRRARRS